MKRCPQCEFIYEDTQNLCDMDGRDLVYDYQPSAGTSALMLKPMSRRSSLKRSPVVGLIGIVVGVVLLAVGYASFDSAISSKAETESGLSSAVETQQIATEPLPVDAAKPLATDDEKVEAVTAPQVAVGQVKTAATRSQAKARKLSERSTGSDMFSMREPSPGKSAPVRARRDLAVARPAADRSGKDKISSLFKKTGRILTKPFKR